MDPHPYPILEFDAATEAIIEPKRVIHPIDVPPHAVLCFFAEVIEKLRVEHGAKVVHNLSSEMGLNPIYEIDMDGRRLAVLLPGLSAPFASAFLEETIALGCSRFVACGGAGVLDSSIRCGRVVVPTSAVRDEGTSYHYLPPGREVAPTGCALEAMEETLRANGIDYLRGKTWTTDAFYRETPAKVARRREEGCLTVEMEAAAFFAVARFRGVEFGQMLYGGDDVGGAEWDSRLWQGRASTREKLFWLAAEACLRM